MSEDEMPFFSHHKDETLENTTQALAFITQSSQESVLMPWISTLSLVLKDANVRN
jgi:hypothetical protein